MTEQDTQTMNQAIALAQAGLKTEAHSTLTQLNLKYPNEPNLLLWLAFTSAKPTQAENFLNRVAQVDPQNPALAGARNWLSNQFLPQIPSAAVVANATQTPPSRPVAPSERPEWLSKVDPTSGHIDEEQPLFRLPMPLPKLLVYAALAILLVTALFTGIAAYGRYVEKQEYSTTVDFANWKAGGVGFFNYTDKAFPDKPIKVWFYRPANLPKNAPLVFTIPGSDRDGETTRNRWLKIAHDYKVIVFSPEYSYAFYGDTAYNLGNVVDEKLRVLPEARWTFNTIEGIFDYTKQTYGYEGEKYYLYGHSAGAQFVHRMLLFKTQARVAKYAIANAGFYTLPRFEENYPYGLSKVNATPALQKAALGKELYIFLGEQDTEITDFDSDPEVRKQGTNRLERGQTFFSLSQLAAGQLKTPFNWQLTTVPNEGHFDYDIIPLVAEKFFGKKP